MGIIKPSFIIESENSTPNYYEVHYEPSTNSVVFSIDKDDPQSILLTIELIELKKIIFLFDKSIEMLDSLNKWGEVIFESKKGGDVCEKRI